MKTLILHFCIGVVIIISTCLNTGVLAQFYGPPKIRGTDNEDLGILLTVLLLATKGSGCGCGCCTCCGGQNIPIPYPIPIPTNNPIINTYTAGGGGDTSGDGTGDCGEMTKLEVYDSNYNSDYNDNSASAGAGAGAAAAGAAQSTND